MRTKAITQPHAVAGSVGVVLIIAGLLQAIPSYSQVPGNELVVDVNGRETGVADPPAENRKDHEDPEDYVWDNSDHPIPVAMRWIPIGDDTS